MFVVNKRTNTYTGNGNSYANAMILITCQQLKQTYDSTIFQAIVSKTNFYSYNSANSLHSMSQSSSIHLMSMKANVISAEFQLLFPVLSVLNDVNWMAKVT